MANEKRLIDANALIEQIRLMANRTSLGEISPSRISGSGVCHLILTAPTVDAVEVVRCENCRYFGTSQCAMDAYAFDVTEESFCSYGERKDK